MPGPQPRFKIIIGGSVLASQPTFKTLDEAKQHAHGLLERQRQIGSPGTTLHAIIEETMPDDSIVKHRVD